MWRNRVRTSAGERVSLVTSPFALGLEEACIDDSLYRYSDRNFNHGAGPVEEGITRIDGFPDWRSFDIELITKIPTQHTLFVSLFYVFSGMCQSDGRFGCLVIRAQDTRFKF